jgi:hypothetical protein
VKLADIDSADTAVLNRLLTALQNEYRVASYEIARGVVPQAIHPAELAWWRAAYKEVQDRAKEVDQRAEPIPMEGRRDRGKRSSH